jgi:hypothetical protein
MNYRASVLTRVTLETDRLIGEGKSITIFGITVANSADLPALVDIQDASGNNKLTIIVPCKESHSIPYEWIADGGLQIDGMSSGGADVIVTVAHSQAGS